MTNSIFLTGGTGFFGRALLRHFLTLGLPQASTITVLSRQPDVFLRSYPEFAGHQAILFKKGDINDRDSLPWHDKYTHVLHAATDSTLGFTLKPIQRYDQIVEGTRNILDLAVTTGANRFLLTSSGAIYGPESAGLDSISEDFLAGPLLSDCRSAYAHGKRSAEHICALYCNEYGLDIVVARCFAFVGPDLPVDAHFAIGNFIRDALVEDAITVKGDGSALRTYLYQVDLAKWLFSILFNGRSGQAYNVGSDEVVSIAELAYLVRDTLSPNKRVNILGQHSPGVGPDKYIPNIGKALVELGLNVNVPLVQSIQFAASSFGSVR